MPVYSPCCNAISEPIYTTVLGQQIIIGYRCTNCGLHFIAPNDQL